MNFFGIGALELILLLVLGLLLVGPMELVRFARKAGETVRAIKNSDLWKSMQDSRQAVDKVGRELLGGTKGELDSLRQELANVDFGTKADNDYLAGFQELRSEIKKKSAAPEPGAANGTEQGVQAVEADLELKSDL